MYSLLKIHFYKQMVLFFLNICQKNKQVSTKIIPKQNACLTFLDEIHIFLKTLYFSDKICNFLKTLYFSFLRIFYLIKIWYIVSSNHMSSDKMCDFSVTIFKQTRWFSKIWFFKKKWPLSIVSHTKCSLLETKSSISSNIYKIKIYSFCSA